MPPDDDAALAHLLSRHIGDVLTWLDDYPDDQVSRSAVASLRRSVDGVRKHPHTDPLRTAVGLLVDIVWWLETRPDEEADEWAIGKILESVAAHVTELPDPQRRRFLETLDDLATTEQHEGRRYELRSFPLPSG